MSRQPNRDNPAGLKAFEILGNYLEEDGWHPRKLEDQTIYRLGFSGNNGQTTCFAQIQIDLEQFLFYVIAPVKAPEEKRLPVAEFITRANFGLRIGNFELDFNDGEIRYKSSLDFEGSELTPTWIQHAVYPAVKTMDRYFPGILKVIYSPEAPLQIIEEIETE